MKADRRVGMQHIFALLVALQLIQIIVFCYLKDGLFLDEIYSYGLANGMNLPFLSYLEGVGTQWFSSDVIRDYLTVQAGEFSLANVYTNQSLDVHPPLYYWLLHIICALFPNVFSPWFGYVLNFACFIAMSVYLYKISKRVIHNEIVALLPNVLFGFGAALTITIYIRMYALLTVFTLMLIYVLIKIKEDAFAYKNYIAYFAAVLLGSYTQYYFIIFAFFLTAIFSGLFLLQKEWKKLLLFCASALVAMLVFVVTWPYVFEHVLGGESVGSGTLSSLMNLTALLGNVASSIQLVLRLMFNKAVIYLPVMFGLLLLCLAVAYRWKKDKNASWRAVYDENKKEVIFFILLALATGCTFVLIARVVAARYFYFLSPIFVLLFVMLINWLLSFLSAKRNAVWSVLLIGCITVGVVCNGEYVLSRTYSYNLRAEGLEPYINQYVVVVVPAGNVTSSSPTSIALQLMESNGFYILHEDEIDRFEEVVQLVDDPEELLVCVGLFCEGAGAEILSQICEVSAYGTATLIDDDTYYSTVYLLSE